MAKELMEDSPVQAPKASVFPFFLLHKRVTVRTSRMTYEGTLQSVHHFADARWLEIISFGEGPRTVYVHVRNIDSIEEKK